MLFHFLIEEIKRQIKNGLPCTPVPTMQVAPEHGWAPEPVFLLYAVSLTDQVDKLLPILKTIAEKIEDKTERFTDKKISEFEYVLVICEAAENNPSKAIIPVLNTLLEKSCFKNLVMPFGNDPRISLDQILERCAYLHLCIGKALARCKSPKGIKILNQYKSDMRGFLARTAQNELK